MPTITEDDWSDVMGRIDGICAVLSAALLVSGCGRAVQNVPWYEEHAAERQARVAECEKDVAAASKDGDCVNAFEAQRRVNAKASIEATQRALNAYNATK